jgi:putative ABC transport system ATP-binding protein
MIELHQVTKVFHEGASNEFTAVENVDLCLKQGDLTVFRGPSGSGKTTLLTMVGCLSRPTSGRIRLHDEDISGLPENFLTEIRRKTFGFIFQRFNLISGLSVLQNVMIPAFPLGIPRGELEEHALELLEGLGMTLKAHQESQLLSGGEAQRAAIARAMINDPEVLIADEPTANLGTELSHQLLEILANLKEKGKTILVTSHDPLVWRDACVDTVVRLRDGKVVDPEDSE